MKLPVLFSYAYIRQSKPEHILHVLQDPRLEPLMDSGAFTAFNSGKEILLNEYMEFVGKWGDKLFGYMALDKLQDPVTTDTNLQEMLRQGLRPIPIHVFGDDAARMEQLFGWSDWVALGGLRRPHRGAAPVEYVKQKMTWAAGRNVHWLGYTDQPMIKAFRPFSVDCASFSAARMYGKAYLYMGAGRFLVFGREQWQGKKAVSGVDHKRMRSAVLALGVDPGLMDSNAPGVWSTTDSVHLTHDLNAISWVKYSLDVRQHLGTRVFLAFTPSDKRDIDALVKALDVLGVS